jgi:general secretion pathway protein B
MVGTEETSPIKNTISMEVEGQVITRTLPDEVNLNAVPDELKEKFAMAVQQTEQFSEEEEEEPSVSSESSLQNITELSVIEQAGIPDMSYQMHIYASESSERWIKINGKTLYEGDSLIPNLVLREIRQNQIIWESEFTRFRQDALQDYIFKTEELNAYR